MPRRAFSSILAIAVLLCALVGCADDSEDTAEFDDAGISVPDVGPAPSCDDGKRTGQQTDIDCGGPHCEPCDLSEQCLADRDCVSDFCDDGVCMPDECDTIDCEDDETCYRGTCRPACDDGDDCNDDERCFEGHCAPLDCELVNCRDDETCVDGGCYARCQADADCDEKACVDGGCIDLCEDVGCEDDESCYRGTCYSACDGDGDCGDDERCHGDACVPTDCEGVECLDDETCYYGVCYPACDDGDDCESEAAECRDDACIDPCFDDPNTGDEICPAIEFDTVTAEDIGPHSARLVGRIDELPPSLPDEHGLCWSDEQQPDEDDFHCEFLGPPTTTGSFEVVIDGLRAGTEYHFVAAIVETGGVQFGDTRHFTTDAPAPQNVAATQGDSASHVEVTWEAADDVLGYHLLKEGDDPVELIEIDADETSYVDDEAEGIDELPAPADVSASQGQSTETIELSWEGVDVDDDEIPSYDYWLIAIYDDAQSEPSDEVEGYRRPPELSGYRIDREGDELHFADPGDTSYVDETAPSGNAPTAPSQITATSGEHTDGVVIEWDEADTPTGPELSYEVVAVGEDEAFDSDPSDPATGYLDAHPVEHYQLEIGGTWTTLDDADIEDGETLDYRYVDDDAPAPTIEPGESSASDGDHLGFVRLELLGAEAKPGDPVTYRVRATSDGGDGDASDADDGHIGVGDLMLRWQRADEDDDAAYSDITSPDDTTSYDDWDAPYDGQTRHYRAVVEAEGADDEISESDEGFRRQPDVFAVSDDGLLVRLDAEGDEIWSADDHDDRVSGLAINPDTVAVTGSYDSTVRAFDAQGDEQWDFDEFGDRVRGIAIDDQGDVYVGGSDPNHVYKLDGDDGQQLWSSDDHTGEINDLSLDADGDVVTASSDHTVRKIDGDTGDEIWSFDGHTGAVQGVAAGPDGYVYTASSDETVRKLDDQGDDVDEVWSFDEHTGGVRGVAVDLNGYVYTASFDETARKIDPGGEEVWRADEFDDQVRRVTVEPGLYGAFPSLWAP